MGPRRRQLPPGWYPEEAEEVRALHAQWTRGAPAGRAFAAVSPHAGWYFSGRLAAQAVASLAPADTVVVVGGHLPPGGPFLAAREEAFETPLGLLPLDAPLLSALAARLELGVDRAADNTVEVLLPLLAASRPGTAVLWLRAPADERALDLGRLLAAEGARLGRRLVVLGSTDLTHYGPDYGFEPAGSGPGAEAWVREVSDASFLAAALALDGPALLEAGARGAACSAGAAAAALAFAQAEARRDPVDPAAPARLEARLLGYGTSLEGRRAASFVGYGALAFASY